MAQIEDHFAPLPEFEIHFLYDDFSTPCFDGWHTGIMGGSWISCGNLASNFARYHFRRHFGKVVAVDKSMTYIRHARIMQHHGQQEYEKVRPRVGVRAFLPTNDPHQCH